MKKKVLSPGLLLVHLYSTSFLKVPKMYNFKKLDKSPKEEEKRKKLSKRLWTNGADKGKCLSISSKSLYILDNLKLAISYQ